MKKQECPVCGEYAILLKDQKMCWDCYVKNVHLNQNGKGVVMGKHHRKWYIDEPIASNNNVRRV